MYASAGGINGQISPFAASQPSTADSPADSSAERPASEREQLGAVRIARRVLRTVVEQAALHVPGVARMAHGGARWPWLPGRSAPHHGVGLEIHQGVVAIDLYLIVQPGANMVDVGMAVQEAVGAAVEHILGMSVGEINIYVRDVA
jgi:uncharacterized alkaline shock family protein YloU